MVPALSYTDDFAAWRRLAQGAAADAAGRLDTLIEWAPRVAYVLSVTVGSLSPSVHCSRWRACPKASKSFAVRCALRTVTATWFGSTT